MIRRRVDMAGRETEEYSNHSKPWKLVFKQELDLILLWPQRAKTSLVGLSSFLVSSLAERKRPTFCQRYFDKEEIKR
jgi:hypothetical protein